MEQYHKPLTCAEEPGKGDPLSPLIFAIIIEPLAESIRQQKEIEGVTIADQEHKLALYADDIILYIRNLERSLPTLMSAINMYSRMSGYKLNIQKSEAMILGDSKISSIGNGTQRQLNILALLSPRI